MLEQRLRAVALGPDPLQQFKTWFEEWGALGKQDPDAVALATATPDGRPSVRMVLMRGFGPDGFRFFTNYEGRKARELLANPYAAMCFYWPDLDRQVRIEGSVEKLTAAESDAYFQGRARLSQLGAWASHQSQEIPTREELEARVAQYEARYEGTPIPRPEYWGGFRLKPDVYEFWQQGPGRLHDRFLYRPEGDGWKISRLSP